MGGGDVRALVPPPRCPLHRPPQRLSKHSNMRLRAPHTHPHLVHTLVTLVQTHVTPVCAHYLWSLTGTHTRPRVPLDMLALASPAAAHGQPPPCDRSKSPPSSRAGADPETEEGGRASATSLSHRPSVPPALGCPPAWGAHRHFEAQQANLVSKVLKTAFMRKKPPGHMGCNVDPVITESICGPCQTLKNAGRHEEENKAVKSAQLMSWRWFVG